MDLDAAIKNFGGKAGQLIVLDQANLGLPIPTYVFLGSGELFSSVKSEVAAMNPPYIVRGSNPSDHMGLEGIIPTYPNLKYPVDVVEMVLKLRQETSSPNFFSQYEEVYGVVDHTTHALIMEQNRSDTFVNALRHPHLPEFLQMEFVHAPMAGWERRCIALQYNMVKREFYMGSLEVRIELDEALKKISELGGVKKTEEMLQSIMDIVTKVESSNMVTSGYALQFEMGLDQPALFQVRPFKPFSKPAFNFPVDGTDLHRFCFGQTPPEGIEIGVEENDHIYGYGLKYNTISPNGYFNVFDASTLHNLGFIDPGYRHLRVLGFDTPNASMLSHGMIRLMKRAEVVCLGANLPKGPKRCSKVRVISNGADYRLIPL